MKLVAASTYKVFYSDVKPTYATTRTTTKAPIKNKPSFDKLDL
jgi:hypothetical protein